MGSLCGVPVVRRAGYSTSSISCGPGFTRISSAGALVAEAKRATPCLPAFDDTVCGVVGVNRWSAVAAQIVEIRQGTGTKQLELESPSMREDNGHSELVITAIGITSAHYRSWKAHFARDLQGWTELDFLAFGFQVHRPRVQQVA